MLSNRCRSFNDESENGNCFEVDVKSTGEQDGGRAVIVLGPDTSIETDGGVVRKVSVVLLVGAVMGTVPLIELVHA